MAMVRYLIMRTMIFIGCLAATWLLGLRDRNEQVLAVVIAAVASMVISAFVLKPFRQRASAAIAERVDQRVDRKRETSADELAEDAEIERPDISRPAGTNPVTDHGSDSDFR